MTFVIMNIFLMDAATTVKESGGFVIFAVARWGTKSSL